MPITRIVTKNFVEMNSTVRSLFLGIIKIHILHHAAQAPVFGLWLIDELGRHGHNISPGTLYPIFHSLERDGLLKSYEQLVNGKIRKYYRATSRGKSTLKEAKLKVQELFEEMIDGTDTANIR
jgi:DNA-binding PadR family transcriptional regulator